MREETKQLVITLIFIFSVIATISISIVTDNRYDANVTSLAIKQNCNIVTTTQKITITCQDLKIEQELQVLLNND